ncbi:hypothetical protein [Desulfoluna spongiiphila]|uniref:hypothetical protein n=1 Tax=Desulfoluna spongiiphila TaxID=419481 RepID=UPI001587EDD4|nr:hypothetical protein [Desulfoluna spongiiphila]
MGGELFDEALALLVFLDEHGGCDAGVQHEKWRQKNAPDAKSSSTTAPGAAESTESATASGPCHGLFGEKSKKEKGSAYDQCRQKIVVCFYLKIHGVLYVDMLLASASEATQIITDDQFQRDN